MKYLKSILGWGLAVVLWIVYSGLFGFYLTCGVFGDPKDFMEFSKVVSLAITPFLLIGLCIFLITKQCRKRGWDSKGYWRIAILGISILPLIWLTIDDPPIKNDYSINDIALSDENAKASYDTLMKFRKGDGLKVNIEMPWSKWTCLPTNALASSNDIEKAWEGIAEARKIIEKLNTYDKIVDITPDIPLDPEIPIMSFVTIRNLAHTYSAYAMLKSEQGKPEEGVKELIKFNSVVRKALPHSALLIHKMTWIGVSGVNIRAVHQIVLSPNCTTNVIRELVNGFIPFTEEDISLRRVFLEEYVNLKNICQNPRIRNDYFRLFAIEETPCHPILSRIIYGLGFNPNMTISDLKTHCNLLLDGVTHSPQDVSAADAFVNKYSSKHPFKNMAGNFFVSMAIPSFTKTAEVSSKTKVLSDLLAIELHKKLGETLDLPDYITKEKYLTDEKTGVPYSAGFDGKPGTKDDIRLDEW